MAHTPAASATSPTRFRAWLRRDIKPTDIVLAIAATLIALGFTVTSPNRRFTAIEARETRSESRIDTLSSRLEFTNYLQCVQLRRTDPTMLPSGCMPLLERQNRP